MGIPQHVLVPNTKAVVAISKVFWRVDIVSLCRRMEAVGNSLTAPLLFCERASERAAGERGWGRGEWDSMRSGVKSSTTALLCSEQWGSGGGGVVRAVSNDAINTRSTIDLRRHCYLKRCLQLPSGQRDHLPVCLLTSLLNLLCHYCHGFDRCSCQAYARIVTRVNLRFNKPTDSIQAR